MPPPTAALSYPLLAYNYRVLVDTISMRFSKIDGLVWERKALTYRDGLSFKDGESIDFCRVDSYIQLTLQQGVIEGDTTLHNWLQAGDARWLQIQLCRADGQAVMAWQASRAIPVKLTVASLEAKTNEVCIDSLELRAGGLSLKHPL